MRRFLFFILLLAGCLSVQAQDDPVVMQVAGEDIFRSEFEYFLDKNLPDQTLDLKTLQEYAGLYVNFKLKVAAAKEAGIDTTAQFLKEFREYRNRAADAFLIDSSWIEVRAKDLYDERALNVGPTGYYEVSVITIIPKGATDESIDQAKVKIDSLRQIIISREKTFAEVAKTMSDDIMGPEGGYMGWIARPDVPDFVSNAVFSFSPDSLSVPVTITEPCWTEVGWMMFCISGHKDMEPYEHERPEILDFMDRQGYNKFARYSTANKIARESGWKLRDAAALDTINGMLEQMFPEFGHISKEYYEGLLLFEISNRNIWSKVSSDTLALENWFAANKNKYKYDVPVFKGCVVFCRDEKTFDELKHYTEAVSLSDLPSKIAEFNGNDERVRFIKGPFRQGVSTYCDAVVFGMDSNVTFDSNFSCPGYIGKVLDVPEEWTDVPGLVISDLQDAMEKEWVSGLSKHFGYRINKKALKSMASHE